MHFKTIAAAAALAATAAAVPERPSWAARPAETVTTSVSDCAQDTTTVFKDTTTVYKTFTYTETKEVPATTSKGIEVQPVGGGNGTGSGNGSNSGVTTVAPADCTPSTVTAAGSTTTVTVSAGPSAGVETPKQCINEQEAEELAEVFRTLIQEYSDGLALAALTEDFVDYSSAVNIIMNKGAQYPKDIGGPTFASRQAFMDGQGSQPKIPFERLVTVHGCDSVSVRWVTTRSANGQATEVAMIPVYGNGIMKVVPSEEPVQTYEGVTYHWRVKELYSEFNTAAWLVNLGVFTPAGPVDYINQNATSNSTVKRSIEHFDPSLRGPMI